MNQYVLAMGTAAVVMVISGCATVDPMSRPQTARDLQSYNETNLRPVPAERYKLVVLSKVTAHKESRETTKSSGLPNDEYKNDQFLGDAVEKAVAMNFSNLGWFDTVDRKNGIALSTEQLVAGLEATPGAAQYALVADSSLLYVAKQGWKRTNSASKARGAEVSTDFRIIDLTSKEPILAKKVVSIVADCAKGGVKSAIEEAATRNAQKFARLVSSRLLPEVRVKQTRDNGRYAQIAMGRNYQAVPAKSEWKVWPYKYLPLCFLPMETMPATTIDFFYNDKDAATNKLEPVVFAHGKVIRATQKDAWVEVDNYKTANVMKGHDAKVSDEDEAVKELE